MKKIALLILLTVFCTVFSAAVASASDTPCNPCGVSVEAIAAYPEPNVQQLPANETLLSDRRYERVSGAITVYNAPNGTPTRVLDSGFNFLTTQGTQDTWTQINPDEWVLTESLNQVTPSRFAGVTLPEEALPYPMAWMALNTVPSRTPGAEPIDGDLAVLRLTVVNIYATVHVDTWDWYQIGVDQWVEQRNVARIVLPERPEGIDTEKWIAVDLYEQVAIAYENNRPVFATLISSGLAEWPTNEGVFHVYARFPRTIMSGAEGQPDFYFLEEVPWTMYFDNDIGLHGTYWHGDFGYRHSHGCVNLSITDSAWLYNWSASEIDLSVPGDTGAAVYVWSSGQYR